MLLYVLFLTSLLRCTDGNGDPCVTSCDGVADGFYHSCNDCDVYATCSGGVLYDDRECPGDQLWADDHKLCLPVSDTCPFWQDWGGWEACSESCGSGVQTRRRTCTGGVPGTPVCPGSTTDTQTCNPQPCVDCVSSCSGVTDGDYHSCNGCDVYVSCSGGTIYDNRPCTGSLEWDDNVKYCVVSSATCPGE